MHRLRKSFLSGLLLLAPIGVTVFVIGFLMDRIAVPARDVIFPGVRYADLRQWDIWALNVISLVLVLAIVTFFGWLSQLVIGRYFVAKFEQIVDNLPGVRTVYNTVKQIRDTFVQQQKAVFQQSVLIEYPRKGVWVLGFLTSTAKGEAQERTAAELMNVFVPTTPNPTSGFLLMVPREEVTFLEMSISDGMKLIISGGAVVPPYPAPKKVDSSPEPAELPSP